MNPSDTNLLVVEDEPEMRAMIADYLRDMEGYSVSTAVDGVDALENVLPRQRVDLVLSDINMPRMKGFELLSEVRRRWPDIKRMLVTAYNVEDYFELAMKYDVGNIFVKTSPFNFGELSGSLRSLLTGDIFGPQRYFADGTHQETLGIHTADEILSGARRVMGMLPDSATGHKLELVVVEILTNAVFYGARNESAEDRAAWVRDFVLPPEKAITVTVMHDTEKCAVAIKDSGGRLSKHDILYWLNRQVSRDEQGLPLGVFDTHGRGLFIARRYIDRLIINIDRARCTEVVIINHYGKVYEGFKPLYINEI
jgi:CheY-like chemotaxis protein